MPDNATDPQTPAAPESRGTRIRRWIVRRVVTVALILVGFLVLIFLMQRKLMYGPRTASAIEPDSAGLPEGRVWTVEATTADGLSLKGWLVLPAGVTAPDLDSAWESAADARGVVLYFSGNAGNRVYRADVLELLTDLGVATVLIDYRGYGENSGSPSESGLYADARAAWELLIENDIDAGKIVVTGESLGGGVAVRLTAEKCSAGEPPAGLLVQSTFDRMASPAQKHYPFLPVELMLRDRYESITRIDDVTVPYLHLHGTADRIVPIEFGERLFEAAPDSSESGIAKEFVRLKGADHNALIQTHRVQYAEAVGRFFDRVLPRESGAVQN